MNIVFLDIDGPIISTPHFQIDTQASMGRTVMSTNAIGWLNLLLREANAKLVTNSCHNYHTPVNDLRTDLIKHGIKEQYFHEDWRTSFPNMFNRLGAIEEWLRNHPGDHTWVCFDDEHFTQLPNLIPIDGHDTITFAHFRQALNRFGKDINLG